MTVPDLLIALGIYAGILALLLLGYWIVTEIQDRMHARRTVAAFDRFVARQNANADRSQ